VQSLETDYLVVGTGNSGLAFADELVTHSDADVILVDRRDGPGGHWNDAYAFLRLHQPSAFYGVNSRALGNDTIDKDGQNAGFYERATAAEVLDYYRDVLDEMLTSGRVRFFGSCDYAPDGTGAHRLVSLVDGTEYEVTVRRKLVDATYLETPIPQTHTVPFEVGPGAHVVPVNGLVDRIDSFARFVIVGAGKTSMDACTWLLDRGVSPDRIQWIRPRDAWILDRAAFQPLDEVASIMEAFSLDLEAAAGATSVDDLFERLDARERVLRIDESIEPTMYHCAILSLDELAQLRRIDDVVRLGRVVRIDADSIELEHGSIPTTTDSLHVDCTASGLRVAPARPVFERDRITIQQIRVCSPSFNSAIVGYVEATRDDLDEQNRLCPPTPYPNTPADWIRCFVTTLEAADAWLADPDLRDWVETSRVNLLRGMLEHAGEPRMQQALERYAANLGPGLARLRELQDDLAVPAR
jgi:hypothetical protein